MKPKFIFPFTFLLILVGGCQAPNIENFKERSKSFLNIGLVANVEQPIEKPVIEENSVLPLQTILDGSMATGSLGSNFSSALKSALDKDPSIISRRRELEASIASIETSEAEKDFQVSGAVYGGYEDLSENTKGLALVLNASRLVFDGGVVDAEISEKSYRAESARQNLKATMDERALRFGILWIELEKYETLQEIITSRLAILDPLISQLEKVAKAGIGDVSKVASAQRTVSEIRVAQTRISEGLSQARLNYVNAFGDLPGKIAYDFSSVSKMVPSIISDEMVQNAPLIASKYSAYQATAARILAIEAQDDFKVDFEVRASRPFAGSGKDSDESIGLVARKIIFNGGMIDASIKEAKASLKGLAADIRATYREGSRTIKTAQQNIKSMDKAILLAKQNAQLTEDEIIYLRQQLIIGGSTLESVLSAESRLYEAESKEINFIAEKRKSELTIVSSLGMLVSSLDP